MNQTVTAEAAEHMATGRALGGSRYATMVNFSEDDVTCGDFWAARVRSVNEMGKGPPHWYSSVVSWCISSRSRLTILAILAILAAFHLSFLEVPSGRSDYQQRGPGTRCFPFVKDLGLSGMSMTPSYMYSSPRVRVMNSFYGRGLSPTPPKSRGVLEMYCVHTYRFIELKTVYVIYMSYGCQLFPLKGLLGTAEAKPTCPMGVEDCIEADDKTIVPRRLPLPPAFDVPWSTGASSPNSFTSTSLMVRSSHHPVGETVILREVFPDQHNFLSAGKSREALDLRKILVPSYIVRRGRD